VPSVSPIDNTSHPPPLSAKLPPPLRALVSNENMESNVEKIRMELIGSDLSRKLALLSEVWALEVTSIDGILARTCSDATESFTSDFRLAGEDLGYLSILAPTITAKLTAGTSTYLSH